MGAGPRRVLLGLGSNLGDRAAHLRAAVAGLGDEVVAVSPVYETAPVGGPEQGAFLNVVVELRTAASARDLLVLAQRLEAEAERVRTVRWGPRTLDVDVLWIDGETVDQPDLVVPHPRMFERAFVLVPLGDVAPDLVPPEGPGDTTGVVRVGPLDDPANGPAAVRVVGPGRLGGALTRALGAAGWTLAEPLGRDASDVDLADAADGVDAVLITTPDAAVAEVAGRIRLDPTTVVVHAAGSLGLDVLAPHERRASVHPLVAVPDAAVGAERLVAGAWFAVAGDPFAGRVVDALGGRSFVVADEHRAAYHAAACIASNHLVALMGQVERVAGGVDVPLAAYLDLVRATIENVAALGPAAALTGPAARGDEATLDRHRAALAPDEIEAYDALVHLARRLVDGPPDRAG